MFSRWFKRSKEQKASMASVKSALKVVTEHIEKHIDLNDKKILELQPYQLILGTTQLLWEDQLIREGKTPPIAMILSSLEQPQQTTNVEKKEDEGKKTWH